MKLPLALLCFALCAQSYAQTGIGTDDPQATLDVNGDLRIRSLPQQDNNIVLTADANGNIGKSNVFFPTDVDAIVAASNVDRTVNGFATVNNVNLGLSISITVPPNRAAIVVITYSVPLGTVGSAPEGYYGIRFLRNGVEAPAGSRKFTVQPGSAGASANMVTVGALYTERLASAAVARTFTYSLNGYIEQNEFGNHFYRFNMWSPVGPNFNWGRATISKIVYFE